MSSVRRRWVITTTNGRNSPPRPGNKVSGPTCPCRSPWAKEAPELLGAFNVYGFASTEFKPFDEELMKLFTAGAGAAIADSRRWRQAHEHIEQLHCAMESRAEIEQAKGVLIAIHASTPTKHSAGSFSNRSTPT